MSFNTGEKAVSVQDVIEEILAEEAQLSLSVHPLYGTIRQTGHRPALVTVALGGGEVTGTSFDARQWADTLLMAVMAAFWDSYVETWNPPGDPAEWTDMHAAIKESLMAHIVATSPAMREISAISGGFGVRSLAGPVPLVQVTFGAVTRTVTAPKALALAAELFAAAASAELTGGLYLACSETEAGHPGLSAEATQYLMTRTMEQVAAVQAETRRFEEHMEDEKRRKAARKGKHRQ